MKRSLIITLAFLLNYTYSFSQVGIGTQTPHSSAMLDVVSNSKGVLITRMTQKDKNAISSPATGLLIYQTDIVPGFYYYTGSEWKFLTPGFAGTSNRINISSGLTPTIDIASNYIGQSSITTLGTVTSGTWNASPISASKGGAGTINGILKANGSGVVSAAVSGVDFLKPNTAISGATKTKITYNAQGLVTNGTDATTSDILEGSNQYFTNSRARAAITLTTSGTSGAATYNSSTGVLNIPQYSGGSGGSVYTFSTPLSLSGSTVSILKSSATSNGYLSSTDWNTFNNKLSTTVAASTYAPIASPTFTGNVSGITKTMVGLANVDNTSDLDKPISTATQSALDKKVDANPAIIPSTKTKITFDSKGLITTGEAATTTDIDEGQNLYFTEERVRRSKLTGLDEGKNEIVDSTDQLLAAIAKLQAQITALQNAINGKLIKKSNFSGLVQKGPFIQGTQVIVSDLDKYLNQTGSTFITQIANQNGYFSLDSIALTSGLVKLSATGYYFNENTGTISDGPLTLHDFVDVKDITSANINILTSLEKERIEKLYKDGMSISEAKTQAQKEILKIFGFDNLQIGNSETLNISSDGLDNAVLLAISVILQQNRSTGQLSEMLAQISADIKNDGTLDNISIQSELNWNRRGINSYRIRKSLENRYASLNTQATIPDFESLIKLNNPKLIDNDGNSYRTTVIGNYEWMIDNLKVTKFSNGDPIEEYSNPNDDYDGYYRIFENPCYATANNLINYDEKFGFYYNSLVALDNRNVCPTGWHVPTYDDFKLSLSSINGVEMVLNNDAPYNASFRYLAEKICDIIWSTNIGVDGVTNETNFSAITSGYVSVTYGSGINNQKYLNDATQTFYLWDTFNLYNNPTAMGFQINYRSFEIFSDNRAQEYLNQGMGNNVFIPIRCVRKKQ